MARRSSKKRYSLAGRRRRRSGLGESIIPSKGEVGTAVLFTVVGVAIIGSAMFILPMLKPVSEQDKQAALLRASQR